MSAKHTWRYVRSGYGSSNGDFDIVNESGGRIASTPYEDKARLFTAAPELLFCLTQIMNDLPAKRDWLDPALEAAARAALAKARGEA